MKRRDLLVGLGGSLAVWGIAGPRKAIAAGSVTLSGTGGAYSEAMKKYQLDTFEQETGVKVQFVIGASAAHALSVRSNPTRPPLDVFGGSHTDLVGLINDGFMEVLPEDKMPNLTDVHPKFRTMFQGRGVGNDYGATGIAYSTKLANPPQSWRDFVERTAAGEFGKGVFFPNVPLAVRGVEVMMLVARAFTGNELNFGAALEQIKRIKPYVVKFFSSPNDPVVLLERGEASVGVGYDGRTWAAADASGGKMAWLAPRDGAVGGIFGLGAVKNGQKELAFKLINNMLRPEFQSQLAAAIGYGVSNTKAQYTGKMATRIAKAELLYIPDPNIVLKNSPSWFEVWNREMVGG